MIFRKYMVGIFMGHPGMTQASAPRRSLAAALAIDGTSRAELTTGAVRCGYNAVVPADERLSEGQLPARKVCSVWNEHRFSLKDAKSYKIWLRG
jgi:hypothetical protein